MKVALQRIKISLIYIFLSISFRKTVALAVATTQLAQLTRAVREEKPTPSAAYNAVLSNGVLTGDGRH